MHSSYRSACIPNTFKANTSFFWQTFQVLVKTTVYPNTFWLRIYTKKGEKVVKVCLHFDSLQFNEFFTNTIILIFSIQNLLGHLLAVK